MSKFNVGSSFIRTKRQICNDYLDALINKGILPETDRQYYSGEGMSEIYELLLNKLYETEDYKGVKISTLDAWYHWCVYVIRNDPKTGLFVWNKFVKNVFLDIERNRYTCILASRGIGKSFISYGLYSIFKMFLFRYTEILTIANIPKMNKRNVRVMKRIIETNELLYEKKEVNKGKELIWTQEQLEYNGGIFDTGTVGSTPRSAHVNFIFVDDCLRDDNKYSDEEVENYILGQLLPCAQRYKARMIVTGTPMHIKDIYHNIMNEKPNLDGKRISDGRISAHGFYSRQYSIISDWEKKEIYLPELWSWEELVSGPMSILNVQGQAKFMREYMLICTDESTSVFSERLVESCVDSNYEITFVGEQNKIYIQGCDVATSGAASADFSAFIVLELLETATGYKKIVRHIVHEKGMPITGERDIDNEIIDPGQVDTIQEISQRYNNAVTIVEKNNVGVALIQELVKRNVNVESFVTDKAKKEGMIRYLVNEMMNGNLIIPDETPEVRELKKELTNFGVRKTKFGRERMEALSGHDDLVIALAIANTAAQQYNLASGVAICQD